MYLKGCEAYGLKTQDLFQVNDLFEAKNLYMIVDNITTLGGMVSLKKDLCGFLSFRLCPSFHLYGILCSLNRLKRSASKDPPWESVSPPPTNVSSPKSNWRPGRMSSVSSTDPTREPRRQEWPPTVLEGKSDPRVRNYLRWIIYLKCCRLLD